MDMNDRALRAIVSSLGGASNGFPREDGFDITVASEVMAIFCLASDLDDLEARLGRIVVGRTRDKSAVTAADLKATGAMSVLLKDAVMPNLVQSLEGTPAFVHGGPFANIAHGCNSVIATKAALKLADYVVTEAGFGADLGAEKFFDIKCRKAGLKPQAAVVVATVRALKMHGGAAKDALGEEDLVALRGGPRQSRAACPERRQVRRAGRSSRSTISPRDTAAEHELIARFCRESLGVEAVICRHWAEGGAGTEELAHKVVALADRRRGANSRRSIRTPCRSGTSWRPSPARSMGQPGWSPMPRCGRASPSWKQPDMVTCRSASPRPNTPSRPIQRCAARPAGISFRCGRCGCRPGAGFVVAICGDIMTMPGLPRLPAAERIHIDPEGADRGAVLRRDEDRLPARKPNFNLFAAIRTRRRRKGRRG